MTLLNQTYITDLKIYVQTLPYERISALPTLKDLGRYIRIKDNGTVENFTIDTTELEQSEVVLVRGPIGTVDGTVYRRTNPRGNLIKHALVDITSYWEFFSQPSNFSVEHFTNLNAQVKDSTKNNFATYDVDSVIEGLNDLLFAAQQRLHASDATQSDRAIYDEVYATRELLYMRLASDLVNEKVLPTVSSVVTVPMTKVTFEQIDACPWLSDTDKTTIVNALYNPLLGFTHPSIHMYQHLPFLMVKVESKYYLITENRIYDVTKVDQDLTRFFVYVK